MTEMVSNNGDSGLYIRPEQAPTAAIQAIYHHLTSKVEKLNDTYHHAYTISINDLDQLHARLTQCLQQYNVENSSCELILAFKSDQTQAFSSYERFSLFNSSISCPTKKIFYKFDFVIILPTKSTLEKPIPQRYTVKIIIDQDFLEYDEQDNDIIKPPAFLMPMFIGENINSSIEYADYAVARNIQSMIAEWVGTLPTRKTGKTLKFLFSHGETINRSLPKLIMALSFLGCGMILSDFMKKTSLSPEGALLVLFSIPIIFYTLGSYLTTKIFFLLLKLRPMTYILFTNGDDIRKRSIDSSRVKVNAYLTLLGTGVVLAAAVNIFSSYLFKLIFI